jgi:hypothetical protein
MTMKKLLGGVMLVLIFVSMTMFCTSCATVFGGRVSECQRTKPAKGEPVRQIRAGALIADVLFGLVPVAVDFATNAIYKPCGK